MNDYFNQKEENQKEEESSKRVMTNLWEDSDSDEMTDRNQVKKDQEKEQQIDTYMVVKKQQPNLDSSPFNMDDDDQIFQIDITPGQFEEQKGVDPMRQAAQAAESALDKALLKEKDEKIAELEIAMNNLEDEIRSQED